MKVLKINASARFQDSISRELVDEVIQKFKNLENVEVLDRDLTNGVSLLTEAHIQAFYTNPDERSEAQVEILRESDQLVNELIEADTVVIGVPIYNFGVPASLKAWADLVARVGITFSYTQEGPKGLIADKPVYLVVTSGGTAVQSEIDYASRWLTHFLSFIGLTNTKIIDSSQMMVKGEDVIQLAKNDIERITVS